MLYVLVLISLVLYSLTSVSWEGQQGRIMVEMPYGISQPERMRKMLQGSANLEFGETYNSEEIAPYLQQLDTRLANGDHEVEAKDSVAADSTKNEVAKAEPAKAAPKLNLKKGDEAKSKINAEKQSAAAIKAHPLLARLQLVPGQGLSTVGYASVRDTAAINKLIHSALAKQVLPSDLKLLRSAKPADHLNVKNIYELHALEGDYQYRSRSIGG